MHIKEFKFNKGAFDSTKDSSEQSFSKGDNWPVVYLLENGKELYVGETNNFRRRMKQHLDNPTRSHLNRSHCIVNDTFNKSAVLDIEAKLINYFAADNKFKILNANGGIGNQEYYDRSQYLSLVEPIWDKLRAKHLADKTVFEIENSDLFKFSPYKSLSIEQFAISKMVMSDIKEEGRSISFIEGNPGTGKTVLAMYFLKQLAKQYGRHNVALVVSMDSLYKTLRNVAKSIDGLYAKNIIKPSQVVKHDYTVLIVDEAHRLKRRQNLSAGGEYHTFDKVNDYLSLSKDKGDQLDWILQQSKHQILFYDANQSIKPTDIPKNKFEELKVDELDDRPITTYSLEQQHRVKGGNEFIRYARDLMHNRIRGPYDIESYDVQLFYSFKTFNNMLYQKEKEYGLTRMVSGYSFDWISKKDTSLFDIQIEGIQKQWNVEQVDWPNSENAIHEVGCIHTIQGYDLNYVFLIFGEEIDYDHINKTIVIDKDKYYDRNGKASIKNLEYLKQYIQNIYVTMMTRGIQGIYMYACNKNFRTYLENSLKEVQDERN
ncbi:MAG: DNA/RNA helicase domain-containing protein [Candidatus Izemoplasma sp.]|nr:DNA/RNA helicase domain-containing protein [Candidatus Izemoplasma sp.]